MITVLVIDDSEVARQAFQSGVEDPQTTVVEAPGGQAALALLRSNPNIKLAFCDMNMPEMTGLEFLVEKAKDPKIAGIPVVMLSAVSNL